MSVSIPAFSPDLSLPLVLFIPLPSYDHDTCGSSGKEAPKRFRTLRKILALAEKGADDWTLTGWMVRVCAHSLCSGENPSGSLFPNPAP